MSVFYKDTVIIDAKEARILSEKNKKNLTNQHLGGVMKTIDEAVSKGLTECNFYREISSYIIEELRGLGYCVKVVLNPREGDFITINW